jgi:hypothetical protein
LLTQRKQLRIDRPKWLDVTLSKRLEKLLAVATADPLNRMELHAVFRSLFDHSSGDFAVCHRGRRPLAVGKKAVEPPPNGDLTGSQNR